MGALGTGIEIKILKKVGKVATNISPLIWRSVNFSFLCCPCNNSVFGLVQQFNPYHLFHRHKKYGSHPTRSWQISSIRRVADRGQKYTMRHKAGNESMNTYTQKFQWRNESALRWCKVHWQRFFGGRRWLPPSEEKPKVGRATWITESVSNSIIR